MGSLKSNAKVSSLFLLFFGNAGTGKTIMASQFPKPTFIDLDKGLGSVMSMAQEAGVDIDFPVYQIDEKPNEDEDFVKLVGKTFASQPAWKQLMALIPALLRKMGQDETLVIDNISRASEYLINYIKKTVGRSQMQLQDWNIYTDEMLKFSEYLHQARGTHVIVIGHTDTIKDELLGAIERTLLLPTKAKHRIPSLADEVWYFKNEYKVKMKRNIPVLQTAGDRYTPAKSRANAPQFIECPTYEKVKPYLEKTLGRKLPEATWTPVDICK